MTPAAPPRVAAALAGLRGRRIHVLGPSGTEGSSVIDFLTGHGVTTITAHDLEPAERFAATFARTHAWLDEAARAALLGRLRAAPIAWRQGPRYLEDLDRAEIIFLPQSWFRHPQNAPVRAAAARGVGLSSMTRLFFEVWPGPVLGVTGTNGKFTVATLIAAMLEAAGLAVVTSGNDRTHVPAFYALHRATEATWLVLEISNRQLVGLPYSPRVAVVTNLALHHLDDHGSFDAYVDVKRTIVCHQGPADVAVLNADDPTVAGFAADTPAEVHWFSRLRPVGRGADASGGQIVLAAQAATADPAGAASGRAEAGRGVRLPVMPVGDLVVPGAHMVENALAAAAAAAAATALAAGGSPEAAASARRAIAGTLRAFRGLPYRFRLVGERDGVAFYEDSLGTNPTSAAAAIRSMTRPYHLIAGGFRKHASPEDFAPMVRALAGTPARAVYLIGSTANVLAESLAAMASPPAVVPAGTLEAAMAAAWERADAGDAVLLSPGCESFDQFADYRERGDRFCALVETLPARARRPAS